MKITPKQLRELIEGAQREVLKMTHQFEYYEAIIEKMPPYLKPAMMKDCEVIKERFKIQRESLREKIKNINKFLAEDDVVNGWQGEDRHIELNNQQWD